MNRVCDLVMLKSCCRILASLCCNLFRGRAVPPCVPEEKRYLYYLPYCIHCKRKIIDPFAFIFLAILDGYQFALVFTKNKILKAPT